MRIEQQESTNENILCIIGYGNFLEQHIIYFNSYGLGAKLLSTKT